MKHPVLRLVLPLGRIRLTLWVRFVIAGFLLSIGASATLRAAAVWESPNWALRGSVGGEVTVDSNIFGFRGGDGDTIFAVQPGFRLERRASSTRLEVNGNLAVRKFLDHSDEDAVDYALRVDYAYPNAEEELPTREAYVSWVRSSEPDLDVGQRVTRNDLDGRFERSVYDTGKTSVDVSISGGRATYSRYDSETLSGGAGVAVGFLPRGLIKYSLGYEYQSSQYDGNVLSGVNARHRAHNLNLRVRGELRPKLTGRISFGLKNSDFSGALDYSKTDLTMGADLTWTPTELRQVSLAAVRRPYFTADGQVSVTTTLNLDLNQQLSGGFSVVVRGAVGRVERQTGSYPDYSRYNVGATLNYSFTGRLATAIGAELTRYSSDAADLQFSRNRVFGQFGFTF